MIKPLNSLNNNHKKYKSASEPVLKIDNSGVIKLIIWALFSKEVKKKNNINYFKLFLLSSKQSPFFCNFQTSLKSLQQTQHPRVEEKMTASIRESSK